MKKFKEYTLEQAEPCCEDCAEEEIVEEAEYQGRKVKLNNPTQPLQQYTLLRNLRSKVRLVLEYIL